MPYLQLFERRTKEVKQKELKHWKHVTAEMMSEEEESGDGCVRHRPVWRSQVFIGKIDCRLAKNCTKTVARRREYGEKCVKPMPKDIPDWLKESNGSTGSMNTDGGLSDELISGGSEDELSE